MRLGAFGADGAAQPARLARDQRDARYELLRGYFHGSEDDTADEIDHERLDSFTLTPGVSAVGRPLAQLALETLGVRVAGLRRSSGKTCEPDGDLVLAEGDTLVVLESMKMEIPVLTERAGTVRELHVVEGEVLQEGDLIATVVAG